MVKLKAANVAIMTITTSSSTRVNPRRLNDDFIGFSLWVASGGNPPARQNFLNINFLLDLSIASEIAIRQLGNSAHGGQNKKYRGAAKQVRREDEMTMKSPFGLCIG